MKRGATVGLVVAGVVGIAAGVGAWASHGSARAAKANPQARIDPHVAAGAHDFVQFACAACHGSLGRGGVSPFVPALNVVGKALTVASLTRIITHGWVSRRTRRGPSCPSGAP